jgi:O-6-methylguanine DNA methyltransferase
MIELCIKDIEGVWFGVAYEEKKVLATSFSDNENKVAQSILESLPSKVPVRAFASSSFADNLLAAMKNVYDGKDCLSSFPLSMERLPTYTQRVLRTVSQIPVGYVSSYGGIAEACGGGARAVGNVMANNPFAPIVPCHRVVTSNLGLGGYGGGLRVKFEFLKREKKEYTGQKEISVDGRILKVFPVELVLKKLERNKTLI